MLPLTMLAQSTSCLTPPPNDVSLDFVASVKPTNCQPLTVLVAFWYGAVPFQVTGLKLFQSILMGASGARFPSLSSNPAAVPMGPVAARTLDTRPAASASTSSVPAAQRTFDDLLKVNRIFS